MELVKGIKKLIAIVGIITLSACDNTSSKTFEFAYNGESRDKFEEALRGKLIQYRDSSKENAQITSDEQREFFNEFLMDNDLILSQNGRRIYDENNQIVYFDQLGKLIPNYVPKDW